jgi:hypothetical protein
MMPQRIQRRRAKGWRMPEGAICIDRSTPWGNPFVVGHDGTVAECVKLHRLLLNGFICLSCKASIDVQQNHLEYAKAHIGDLIGHDLACWCRIGAACHGDNLLEAAKRAAETAAPTSET